MGEARSELRVEIVVPEEMRILMDVQVRQERVRLNDHYILLTQIGESQKV
jgi:hypothetical protein